MEQPDNMVARSSACSGSFHCIAALGHAMLLATSLAAPSRALLTAGKIVPRTRAPLPGGCHCHTPHPMCNSLQESMELMCPGIGY